MDTRLTHLDGVRALACLSVVAFHAGVPGCAGLGMGGVQVFFVLSGYLITRILRERAPPYGTFFLSRLRRLAPALGALIIACLPWTAPENSALAAIWAMDFALFLGERGGLLGHTWTLSLEMQFYLFWPLVVRRIPNGFAIALAILALALWEIWIWAPTLQRALNPAGLITGAFLAYRPIKWPDILRRALAWTPLLTIGRLSYGIYLWHYPVIQLFLQMTWLPKLAVALPLSMFLAAMSYLTLERYAGCAREPLWPRATFRPTAPIS
jgi:peptidoglycan/LPS O-acetylase OafA/YrhL